MSAARSDARAIVDAAVEAVQADNLLRNAELEQWLQRPLHDYREIGIVSIGKAGLALAAAMHEVMPDAMRERLRRFIAAVPASHRESLPDRYRTPGRLEIVEAGHPEPNQGSVAAGHHALEIASNLQEDDLLVVLVSGGGSALCVGLPDDVSLKDLRETYRCLLESGADIHAMNAVRKHLSTIKGGRLARAAAPAETLALVVSDVPGDDLSVIASGPTAPDESTYAEALDVLEEGVGPVPVTVRAGADGAMDAELTVARLPAVSPPPAGADDLAALLSLSPTDVAADDPAPAVVSCGGAFVFVRLASLDAVKRARVRRELWDPMFAARNEVGVYLFADGAETPEGDLHARMFAPGAGIDEDPATGAAAAALAGFLAPRDAPVSGTRHWVVEQGFEMGRPSRLTVTAETSGGAVLGVRVAGGVVAVSHGEMTVPDLP